MPKRIKNTTLDAAKTSKIGERKRHRIDLLMLRSRERGGITQIKIFHHRERRARRGAPLR